MNDKKTSIESIKQVVAEFVQERNWQQFHTAKNLSMAIAVEAAELMELLQWLDTKEDVEREMRENKENIEDEIADIFAGLFSLCSAYNIDVSSIIAKKMAKNRLKYPVDSVRADDTASMYKKYRRAKAAYKSND